MSVHLWSRRFTLEKKSVHFSAIAVDQTDMGPTYATRQQIAVLIRPCADFCNSRQLHAALPNRFYLSIRLRVDHRTSFLSCAMIWSYSIDLFYRRHADKWNEMKSNAKSFRTASVSTVKELRLSRFPLDENLLADALNSQVMHRSALVDTKYQITCRNSICILHVHTDGSKRRGVVTSRMRWMSRSQ